VFVRNTRLKLDAEQAGRRLAIEQLVFVDDLTAHAPTGNPRIRLLYFSDHFIHTFRLRWLKL
jgi:hypothetical protein